MERVTLITKSKEDYELLDSGKEEKLERYGDIVLARPDNQALWEKSLSEAEWKNADGHFIRKGNEAEWVTRADFPKEWPISFGGLTLIIRPTSFKHTGLFPEQLSNWEWAREKVSSSSETPSILNLFGYTGGATLAVAQVVGMAGCVDVCHVDASKTAVLWARENAMASGLSKKPIRWVVEDALLFVKREIKRGKRYDGIIMDPPAFGHGPKNELWKIEKDLIEIIRLCGELLSDDPLFFLVNGYAAGYSPLAFAYNLEQFEKKYGGTIEYGDLLIEGKANGRFLPAGIFARYSKQ